MSKQDRVSRVPEDDDLIQDDRFADILNDDGDEGQPIRTPASVVPVVDERPYLQLIDRSAWIRRRAVKTGAKIIQCKQFSRHNKPIEYWRVKLLLYLPWVNEIEEIQVEDPMAKL